LPSSPFFVSGSLIDSELSHSKGSLVNSYDHLTVVDLMIVMIICHERSSVLAVSQIDVQLFESVRAPRKCCAKWPYICIFREATSDWQALSKAPAMSPFGEQIRCGIYAIARQQIAQIEVERDRYELQFFEQSRR